MKAQNKAANTLLETNRINEFRCPLAVEDDYESFQINGWSSGLCLVE